MLGWDTNGQSRQILIDEVKEFTEGGLMGCHERVFLDECGTFVQNQKGKFEARQGPFYDDSIVAWAIALQVRKDPSGRPATAPGDGEIDGLPERLVQRGQEEYFW